jgi:hypothetical protein
MDREKHFFLLGAAKCGTTSLHKYLGQHQEICMSSPKEPPFFELYYDKGISFYEQWCFANKTSEIWTGESRHRNLYLPFTIKRIAKEFPDARLLVVIRHPVERAFSHYLHRVRHGFESLTFEQAVDEDISRINRGEFIDNDKNLKKYEKYFQNDTSTFHRTYIDTGYYAEQFKRVFEYFNKEQLLIINFEDLAQSPQNVVNKSLHHIDPNLKPHTFSKEVQNRQSGVTYEEFRKKASRLTRFSFIKKSPFSKPIATRLKSLLNKRDKRTKPEIYKLKNETRKFLVEHFRQHNEHLSELTNCDYSHWNS